jgi:hypothetical protein
MDEPKSKAEVANWCIVNALRLPNELIVSITAKLMLHLTDEEREQVLHLSSVAGQSEQLSEKLCKNNLNFKCNCINQDKCPNFQAY